MAGRDKTWPVTLLQEDLGAEVFAVFATIGKHRQTLCPLMITTLLHLFLGIASLFGQYSDARQSEYCTLIYEKH